MPPHRHRFLDQHAESAARRDGWATGSPLVNRTALLLTTFRLTAAATRRDFKVSRWRLDFAWPEHRLALCVEPAGQRADGHAALVATRRDAELRNMGWVVFRVDDAATAEQFSRQVARAAKLIHLERGTELRRRIALARTPADRPYPHGNTGRTRS